MGRRKLKPRRLKKRGRSIQTDGPLISSRYLYNWGQRQKRRSLTFGHIKFNGQISSSLITSALIRRQFNNGSSCTTALLNDFEYLPERGISRAIFW